MNPADDRTDASHRTARLEQRVRELATIVDVVKTLTSTLELPQVLRLVLDRIKVLTNAEALSLLLYDSDRDELVFAATETLRENAIVGLRLPPEKGIASWVAHSGQSARVSDTADDPRFYSGIDRVSHFESQNLLAVPLRRQGRVVGAVEVVNRYGSTGFSAEDQARLEALADALGERMDPALLSRDADAMREFLANVVVAVPSRAASLLLFDPEGRELVFKASRTLQAGVVDGLRIGCDQGIAGWVARHREAVCVEDVANDPRHLASVGSETHFQPRTMLCVPLVSKETLHGVIQVINKVDGTAFGPDELRMVQILADHAAIAIENASLYHRAYAASITDDLTGLGNTRHFNIMLPALMERGGPLSLLVFDLDNFKHIVDTYGHLVGSRTIGYIGKIISHLVRPGDVAARFGGDEFVVILPGTDAEAAAAIGETIRQAVEACSVLEGNGVDLSTVTASVGVATFPDHATTAEGLFHAADAAMYAVKRGTKNGVGVARSTVSGTH